MAHWSEDITTDVVDEPKVRNNRDKLFRGIHWNVMDWDWRDYATVLENTIDASYAAKVPVWSGGGVPLIINFGALWERHEINLSLMGPLTMGDIFNHVRDFLHTYTVPFSVVAEHAHTFSKEYFTYLREHFGDSDVPLAFVDERSVLRSFVATANNRFDAMFDYA